MSKTTAPHARIEDFLPALKEVVSAFQAFAARIEHESTLSGLTRLEADILGKAVPDLRADLDELQTRAGEPEPYVLTPRGRWDPEAGIAVMNELGELDAQVLEAIRRDEAEQAALAKVEAIWDRQQREGWPKPEVTEEDRAAVIERAQDARQALDSIRKPREEFARNIRRDFVALKMARLDLRPPTYQV